ncbi:LLM class oxidoreductase [Dietzia psychralcaliphila]|uniref:LLM class oxidoreductase n=1 Tax=Dietzia psychralcaliphila TaxID=139021 RepID=UPI001C1DD1F5|nr:LLM class oxidoreductase [Dietzia psychralcaliphila]
MTSSSCALSDGDPRQLPGFRRTFGEGHLTLGLGFPLRTRADQGDPSDIGEQVEIARAAEAGGFAALYARDIPLRVPSFGDVGQIYDPWVFLTYVAAHTSRIALGTAAVVLPVRHPLHVAKSAASLDRLSGGRFLLGVASGDRPEEFRAFGLEQGQRGEIFRENLSVMTHALTTEMRGIRWSGGWMHSADVVPKPTASSVPLIMTGSCQQNIGFLAEHGDGWMTYPRDFDAQRRTAARWRELVGRSPVRGDDDEVFKPFAQSLQIDLADDPDEAASPIDFGFRIGHRRLVDHLGDLRGIGVNHVLVGVGASRRPIREVVHELADHVVPHFPALAH